MSLRAGTEGVAEPARELIRARRQAGIPPGRESEQGVCRLAKRPANCANAYLGENVRMTSQFNPYEGRLGECVVILSKQSF